MRSQLATLPSWRWRAIVVEAHLSAGALEEAAAALAELTDVVASAGRAGQAAAAADLARLRGLLAEAGGDLDAALAQYTADVADRPAGRGGGGGGAGAPLGVARLAFARGRLLHRRGADDRASKDRASKDHALAALHEARDGFAALGAVPFLDRCNAALAAVGDGEGAAVGHSGGLGFDLSPRQEAVALLVADGLTNKEIAAELYIGVKTVEYHLAQIFARTKIGSRRDLMRQWRSGASPKADVG